MSTDIKPEIILSTHASSVIRDEEYLLFFGRLSDEKGVDVLVDAMRSLPNERLIIVGTGPIEAHLKQKINDKAVSNIKLVGAKYGNELDHYIRASKAVILPSLWYENMPYSMLEALNHGKIVIASALGGMKEIIRDGENGFLFDAGNREDLIKVISQVNTLTREEVRHIETSAQATIQTFKVSTYGNKIEQIYTDLLSEKKSG